MRCGLHHRAQGCRIGLRCARSGTPTTELARLPDSPDLYPQKLDLVRECFLLIHFSEDAYRTASFLDDRILGPATRAVAADRSGRGRRRCGPQHTPAALHLSHRARRLDAR